MALTVFRTTYSGVLKDNMDYSTGFADADGKLAAQGQALRGELAIGVGEPGRVVHVVLEHARISRAEHRQRHLVGDGKNRVLEQLERNRIVNFSHSFKPPRPMDRASTRSASRTCILMAGRLLLASPVYRHPGANL